MKHKTSQSLFTYWNELRAQRIAPRRFEIEPTRLAGMLPDTFILDCSEAGSAQFRLAGTRMSSLLGRDVRNSAFLDLFLAMDHKAVAHILQQVVEQAAVGVIVAAADAEPVPQQAAEIVLLPLFHTEDAVTRILGCAVALEPLRGHAVAAPVQHRLIHHEIIWPDGRPHAILQQMNRQSPFAPEYRGARIVSSERRRFRVFDGGKIS